MSGHTQYDPQDIIAASDQLNEIADRLQWFLWGVEALLEKSFETGKLAKRFGRHLQEKLLQTVALPSTGAEIEIRAHWANRTDARPGLLLYRVLFAGAPAFDLAHGNALKLNRTQLRFAYDALPEILNALSNAFPELIDMSRKQCGFGKGAEYTRRDVDKFVATLRQSENLRKELRRFLRVVEGLLGDELAPEMLDKSFDTEIIGKNLKAVSTLLLNEIQISTSNRLKALLQIRVYWEKNLERGILEIVMIAPGIYWSVNFPDKENSPYLLSQAEADCIGAAKPKILEELMQLFPVLKRRIEEHIKLSGIHA